MAKDVFDQGGFEFRAANVNGRVLLVDENGRDLRFYRLILEGQGYEVSVCTSFEAGIQCLEQGAFDFVMVDQGSPAFEGRRVLERSMQLNPCCPVMVVTACADMNCYVDALHRGAVDYLEKPLPPSALLRFVEGHVRQKNASA